MLHGPVPSDPHEPRARPAPAAGRICARVGRAHRHRARPSCRGGQYGGRSRTRRRAGAERGAVAARSAAQDSAGRARMTALWAVGSYADGDGRRASWEISHDEINRDIGSATRVLSDLDLAGKGVLWCSMLAEAGQFWPYICGTVMAGARLSCADATSGEA